MLKLLLRMGVITSLRIIIMKKHASKRTFFGKSDFDQEPCQQMCTESGRYTKKVVHNIQKWDFQLDSMRVDIWG